MDRNQLGSYYRTKRPAQSQAASQGEKKLRTQGTSSDDEVVQESSREAHRDRAVDSRQTVELLPPAVADPCGRLHRAVQSSGLRLQTWTGSFISADTAKQAIKLVERSMAAFDGWDAEQKMSELTHPATRILILCPASAGSADSSGGTHSQQRQSRSSHETPSPVLGNIAGFASYRFVTQETLKVVYLYELHVDEHWRRQGLGSHLMDAVRDIGRNSHRQGMMLSVHRTNTPARELYTRKSLEVSPVSPSQCAPLSLAANSSYEIMQCLWDSAARSTMAARGAAARRRLHNAANT